MAYPPTVTAINRSNSTPMLNNHAQDHNEAEDALTAILAKIGNGSNASSISTYATMEARYLAYDRGSSILVAHSTSADTWQESADYVIDNTSPTTNITTLNTVMTSLSTAGGGRVLMAPTISSYYLLGAIGGGILSIPSDVTLEFVGGAGTTLDSNANVQAYFASGVNCGQRSSLILGSGTYLTGVAASIFGSPAGGITAFGSGEWGVYIGSPQTSPGLTRVVCHSAAGASTGVIHILGSSSAAPASHFVIENIKVDGSSLGVPGIYLKNVALLWASRVQTFDTAIATNGKGAGILIDNVWDSFFNECRWDWCGSMGRSSSITSGVEANIRGAVHVSDSAGFSNNVQFNNCTIETTMDRAIHIERNSAASSVPNKFYWNNIKIENALMYNSQLIYMDGLAASTITNIDVTSGITAVLSSITATPIWEMKNCASVVIDRYNMELTANANTGTFPATDVTGPTITLASTAALGTSNQYVGWTFEVLTGTSSGTVTTITAHTNTTVTLASTFNVSNGGTYAIYPKNVASFLKFNGGNSDISIGNFFGSSQPYRTPTVAWVEFNSNTDTKIRRNGPVSVYYNGDNARVPNQLMSAGAKAFPLGYEQFYNGSVTTTDATATEVLRIPLPSSSAYSAEITVNAVVTAGTAANIGGIYSGKISAIGTINSSGTIRGANFSISNEGQTVVVGTAAVWTGATGTINAPLTAAGGRILTRTTVSGHLVISVTGLAADTIEWDAVAKLTLVTA